jgi:hypothetical protein
MSHRLAAEAAPEARRSSLGRSSRHKEAGQEFESYIIGLQ